MRHISRTHRVALDWLFGRINLDPKILTIDTKNQLADILTKGNFTRDEWNYLLRFLNVMKFSMFSCSHLSNFLSDPDQEAVRHVKESSGKQPERGIGSGKAEACEFVPLEHEENSFGRGKPSPQLETVCVGH